MHFVYQFCSFFLQRSERIAVLVKKTSPDFYSNVVKDHIEFNHSIMTYKNISHVVMGPYTRNGKLTLLALIMINFIFLAGLTYLLVEFI